MVRSVVVPGKNSNQSEPAHSVLAGSLAPSREQRALLAFSRSSARQVSLLVPASREGKRLDNNLSIFTFLLSSSGVTTSDHHHGHIIARRSDGNTEDENIHVEERKHRGG